MVNDKCQCFHPAAEQSWSHQADIGLTHQFWEVSHMRCDRCGTPWLRAYLEHEAFSKSGRHYRAPTTDGALEGVTAEKALALIEQASFRIRGGSRFETTEVNTGPGKLYDGL